LEIEYKRPCTGNKKGYTIEQIADVTEKSPEEIIAIIEKQEPTLV
jgi:hypothetical protein